MYILPLSVLGVSSHLFRRTDAFSPPLTKGVSLPGVACAGVASHILVLGVAPGVSLPLAYAGVSSHLCVAGVTAYEQKNR